MATKDNKPKKYIVIARSNETLKEQYAVAGVKKVPFDTPVVLTDREVASLERQREPIQVEKQISVHEIMEKHKVTQVKANEIAKMIAADPSQGGKKITFVKKYVIQRVD
jgi:hypothetical protein